MAESLACPTSAPGIGPVTAARLLVGTLNFARCPGPEALAAYAGLVPMPREPGRSVRGRPHIGHDGNGRLRTALYPATLSAARHDPAIRAFFRRLRAAQRATCIGLPAARKLLHLAWALAIKRQRFDPHRGQQRGEVTASGGGQRTASNREGFDIQYRIYICGNLPRKVSWSSGHYSALGKVGVEGIRTPERAIQRMYSRRTAFLWPPLNSAFPRHSKENAASTEWQGFDAARRSPMREDPGARLNPELPPRIVTTWLRCHSVPR